MQLQSLLFTLKPREVQSVIEEFELIQQGYSIEYFVDTYDINLYCFPFGLEKKRKNHEHLHRPENIYLFSDRQVSYNYLFKGDEKNKPILLEEYYDEYSGLRDKIELVFRDFPALREKVINFSRDLLNSAKINSKIDDFALIRDKLSIIVSIALGFSSQNLNSFAELLQRKELLIERRLGNRDLVPLEITEPRFQSLLEEFLPLIEESLRKARTERDLTEADIEALRIKHRLNSFNDAAAIFRTLATNEAYRAQGEKHIVYFVTAAPWIKKVANSHKDLSVLQGNFLRSDAQLFCKLLFLKEDVNKSIDDLKEFKALLEFESKFGYTHKSHDDLITRYRAEIEAKRNAFENYGILVRHNDLTSQLSAALENLEKNKSSRDKTNDLIDTLSKAAEYIQKNQADVDTWSAHMRFNFSELAYKNDVLRLITQDEGSFVVRAYGLDPVESTNHQVPIVFDPRNIPKNSLIKLLEEISFFYTQRHPSHHEIIRFKTCVIDGIKKIQSDYAMRPLEAQLMSFLIYMIVAVPGATATDGQAVRSISQRGFGFRQKYSFTTGEKSNPLLCEYDYVLVWAARRGRDYGFSLEHALKAIDRCPEDPRFYHAVSMAIYCMLADPLPDGRKKKSTQKESKAPEIEISYKTAIEYLDYALLRYKEFQKADVKYCKQTIEVLYNCLAHFHAAAAENTLGTPAASESINHATRNLLLLIKEAGRGFGKYPEYKTTEAYVEYIDFKVAEAVGTLDRNKAIRQLNHSFDLITKSIQQLESENRLQHKPDRKAFYEKLASEIQREAKKLSTSSDV